MHDTPFDIHSLCKQINNGQQPEYVFFWNAAPEPLPTPDQSCLSQWYPAGFTIDGIHYPTAEHYMMAEKARTFEDIAALEKILSTVSPAEAKQLGRSVRRFDADHWSSLSVNAVRCGNLAKFSQNPALQHFLQQTTGKILVEASPYDRIWGIGLDETHPAAAQPAKWRGQNLLGFTLMQVRQTLTSAN